MSPVRRTAALVFFGISLLVSSSLAHADGISLNQVIANVEANEQLYHDIEVVLTATYHLTDVEDGRSKDNLLRNQTKGRRSVSQGTMFYLKVSGGHELVNAKSYDLNSLYGYDGEVTRQVEAGGSTTDPGGKHQAIANTHKKRLNPCDRFLPHTWLISGASPCVTPLSVCLRGGKEFQKYPGNGRHRDQSWKTFLEGEEEVDGLRCVKLRMDSYDIEGAKLIFNTRRFLWLAIERNYLPVKSTGIVMFENPTAVLEECRVKDFRTIGPDIWLPFEKEIIVYDHITLRKDKNKRVVRHTEKETIELAKLDPKYDVSFFRDIEIPDGAVVYEIKDGKVGKGHRQGEAEQDAAIRRGHPFWPWALGLSLLAALLVFGLGYAVWRRTHPRGPAAPV